MYETAAREMNWKPNPFADVKAMKWRVGYL
jgi:hypothetical protein